MKAFRFSLQSLLTLREQKEQSAQQRYSEALLNRDQAAARSQSATEILSLCRQGIDQKLRSGIIGSELTEARAWHQVLETRCKENQRHLEKAEQQLAIAWNAMVAASRDRETIDRHYDKRRLAYDKEARRSEQKELDELGGRQSGASDLLRFAAAQSKSL